MSYLSSWPSDKKEVLKLHHKFNRTKLLMRSFILRMSCLYLVLRTALNSLIALGSIETGTIQIKDLFLESFKCSDESSLRTKKTLFVGSL